MGRTSSDKRNRPWTPSVLLVVHLEVGMVGEVPSLSRVHRVHRRRNRRARCHPPSHHPTQRVHKPVDKESKQGTTRRRQRAASS